MSFLSIYQAYNGSLSPVDSKQHPFLDSHPHDGTLASSKTCFEVSANVESATEHPSWGLFTLSLTKPHLTASSV